MDIFSTGYYKINRISLSICGIWPEQNLRLAYVSRVIILGTIMSIMIPEVIYLYEVLVDGSFINDVIPCIPNFLVVFAAFNKFYLIGNYRKRFQNALDKMRNDWELLGNTPAGELMHEYGAKGRFNTIFYMCFMFASLCLFLLFPMAPLALDMIMPLNESRIIAPLYDTDYGFMKNPDDHFIFMTLHAYVTTTLIVQILWTIDPFIMIMVLHCCGLFEIVGFTLKGLKVGEMSKEEEDAIVSYAIFIHQRAIEFAEFIEESLNTMYAYLIMVNMIAISLTGVETVMKMGHTEQALRFAVLTIGQMAHLFFNNLPGQKLVDHSGRTFEAIYDSDWHSISLKSKKAIIMMLMRSKKPCMLTAGGFYELNMENFSQVVQASMSYLTVLMSMQ